MARPETHPASPFTVRVSSYSLGENDVGRPTGLICHSRHRSPFAAARRLATIIAGKSAIAKEVRACIARGNAGRYEIEIGDGSKYPLNEFRARFC